MGVLIVYTCNWALFFLAKWTFFHVLTVSNYIYDKVEAIAWRQWSDEKCNLKKKQPEFPLLPADCPGIIIVPNLNQGV